LLEKHKKDLQDIINKHRQFKPTYQLLLAPYDPQSYVEVFDGNPLNIETIYSDKYLFNTKNGGENNQPLDSNPETVVFKKLQQFALSEENKDKIKIWAKNLTSSNVSGEYLDDNNSVRHSYFDFIIKFFCGVFLYIEVKGQNDIDPEKTKMLKAAYKDYFEKQQGTFFCSNIVICVVKVADNGTINHECFYNKELITDDLNTETFEGMIKKIPQIFSE
jgi:hypothetical protein